MLRTHFELRYGADTVSAARLQAYAKIAEFMEVSESAAPALVDIELKVSIPDPEKDAHIKETFVVTAYGNVKQSVVKPI